MLVPFTGGPPATAQQASTTLEVRVAADSDDAEESATGSVSTASTDLELVSDQNNQTVGMRFNGISIPRGAKINTAYIQFEADALNSEPAFLTIEGEDTDHAPTFSTANGNISSRPKTSASEVWSPAPWTTIGEAGSDQQTPNLARIVQEITLRPGWISGNSLVIIITGNGTRVAESHDGFAVSAPLLHVEYILGENLNPLASINSPAAGITLNQGNNITFSGTADDFEDGDVTPSLSWTSSIDGNIGTGGSFSLSILSVGIHTITATAIDNAGLTGFDSTTITVFAHTPVLVGAGDIAYDGQRDEETAKLLDTIPGIVVTLGDNAYPDGTAAEFNAYYEPTWGRHKARTLPSVGNHEYDTPGASGYFNYFGTAAGDPAKGYYSYNLGDWHIVVLNSECAQVGGCGVNSPQGLWLQADLAANPSICTLAYFHRPLFSSSSSTTSANVKGFWTLLYNAEADVILNGHAHNYERFALQDPNGLATPGRGIREFVVGTGGANFTSFGTNALNSVVRNASTAGVLKLTLNPTSYAWEFVPIAGRTFTDTGSADCVTTLPPACYSLTLRHTGQGSDPIASPANSAGCSAGTYTAGEVISLNGAAPNDGWQITSWSGTDNNASTASTNTVTMPDSVHSVSVNYMDVVAPTVISIMRADPNPAYGTSVNFRVTFSEIVTGVDKSDFHLTTTGEINNESITTVQGSGETYTIAVNTGSDNGTLRLDLHDDDSIKDTLGNMLGGTGEGNGDFTSGEEYTVIKNSTFADVPLSYWAWRHIESIYNAGITSGCGGGNYCPVANVTRDQMAVFLLRSRHGSGYFPPAPTGIFSDVPTNYWAAAWIEQLAAEGITSGCGGGNYCPNTNVTRDQMAVFLLRSKYGSGYFPPAPTGIFSDVPTNYWAAAWIEQLAAEGITSGCGGGNYCPATNVTRDQMAVFLQKTFGLPMP